MSHYGLAAFVLSVHNSKQSLEGPFLSNQNQCYCIAPENITTMEYSIIWYESKGSTIQLFEKKEILDNDSEIEDFGLESLFEEIDDLPDGNFDTAADSELDSFESRDSLIGCVSSPQPVDDF